MGARFSAPVQTGPGAHPASCTMGTGYFPGVKSGRGVTLTPHTLLASWSRKGRAIPLLPLWAVRPVQSISACTRMTFTFTFIKLNKKCFNIKQANTMQLGSDLYYCTSWLLYMFRAPLAPIIRSTTTVYATSGTSYTVSYNSFLSDSIKLYVGSWYNCNCLLVKYQ